MLRLALLLAALLASPAAAQPALIPAPSELTVRAGAPFVVTAETPIVVSSADPEALRLGHALAALIGTIEDSTPEVTAASQAGPGAIRLQIVPDSAFEPEGYVVDVTADGAELLAATPAGLFYAMQTFRQLMPPRVEYEAARPVPLEVPAVRVSDAPRFAWRGAMLDVARHFFGVDDVKRYIDLMALYKLNRLHLHLSDDQGWRVEIPGLPALTEIGARSEVGGGPGGYYTVADYDEIVRYAADRFVTIVPEIDLPGHTNAALASIPELNCDGEAAEPYTGIRVGFSVVCVDAPSTYTFVEAVVNSLAARTPGDVLHLGGDEVRELDAEAYNRFMARAQDIVTRAGKTFAAWDEVAETGLALAPGSIVQIWRPQNAEASAHAAEAVRRGARLVLSPADRIYLDMKPDSSVALGLAWAGLNDVRDAYAWEPADLIAGVPESAILGVEAPLWSETLATIRDVEFMTFPRLAGVAEIGWSTGPRAWNEYRVRLAAHAPRWAALGIPFYRSPLVDWAD